MFTLFCCFLLSLSLFLSLSLSLSLSVMLYLSLHCGCVNHTGCHMSLLQACGVDFEVKAFIAKAADNPDEVIEKKYVFLNVIP